MPDMKWVGKEKKWNVCDHADKMNQVGTRIGWGADGGGDDEKPNKGSQYAATRGEGE